jgi:hypothetical protein
VLRNEHASEDRDNGAPRDLAALAEERRRALARRFAGSGTQRRATPGTGQPAQAQTGPGVAPNSVRHAAGPSGVGHYLTLIEEALKENNSVSASNTLRVAQSIENLSDAAKRELAAVEPRVQRALSEHLSKQASAEEREGNPDRAAALWARAATANPTLENLERAAVALLRVRSSRPATASPIRACRAWASATSAWVLRRSPPEPPLKAARDARVHAHLARRAFTHLARRAFTFSAGRTSCVAPVASAAARRPARR